MMPAIKNQNWLPSLFNDFFGDEWLALSQYKRMSTPAVNVIENDNDYTVEVAAPGMTKEDFHIDVTADNELVISLEKRSETKSQESEPAQARGDKPAYDAEMGKTPENEYKHSENRESAHHSANTAQTTSQTTAQTSAPAARTSANKPAKNGHYLRREFSYSSFRQSFTLPESIERDKISAKMENGVLRIEIPKKTTAAATPTTRCIEIK